MQRVISVPQAREARIAGMGLGPLRAIVRFSWMK